VLDDAATVTDRTEKALALFNAVANGTITEPAEIAKRIEPMLALLERLDRKDRHADAIRLARALNAVLLLTMRWVAIARSLGIALRAARTLRDNDAIAWAQHELGTLELVAGDLVGAQARLEEAHELRRSGDERGLAATKHNQQALCGRLQLLLRGCEPPPPLWTQRRLALAALCALLLLLTGAVAGAAFGPEGTARLTARVHGRGTVTSALAGIRCPLVCSANLARGRRVSLTASAGRGAAFAGWSGDCAGTNTCRVRLDRARTVSARFETVALAETLSVSKVGSGDGRITSHPSGIDCGSACSTSAERGKRIRLTALPFHDATFAGWTGSSCGDGRSCLVVLRDRVNIVARFDAKPPPLGEPELTVRIAGGGRVQSTPERIDCPATCTRPFADGTQVVLVAQPDGGSLFDHWNDPKCPGAGRCTLMLRGDRSITATFRPRATRFTLTTSSDPGSSGSGTIATEPACSGEPCAYDAGTDVTLTATPGDGSFVSAWHGCEPENSQDTTCTVRMSANRTVEVNWGQNVE
jgi:hypothetical protein